MNKVFLVGRLAADPQPYTTPAGITNSKITIATSDVRNENESYFFPCIAWRNNANFINNYLKKGDLVVIDGKLVRRSYVSKEGKTVYITEIVIETIKPIGGKKANSEFHDNNKQSIDQVFNDNIKTSSTLSNEQKTIIEPFDGSEEIEWIDEIKK